MFNITIEHKKLDEFAGEFIATVKTDTGAWVMNQHSKYEIQAERREAFDKALSWANGFADGVRSVRNHISAEVDTQSLINLAKEGLA